MKDKFKEHACDFKSPELCEEEFDEDGLDLGEAERQHFEEAEQ